MRLLLVFLLAAVVVAQNDDEPDGLQIGSIFGAAIFDHVIGSTHCAPGKCGFTCEDDCAEGPRADLLPPFSQGNCAADLDPEIKNEWVGACECAPGFCGHGCFEKCDYPTIKGPEPMDRDMGCAENKCGSTCDDCLKASSSEIPRQVDY